MKTNFKKTVAMLVLCFTALAFNQVKAQDYYAYAIHTCADYDGNLIIMASNVFNINTAKEKFTKQVGYETVNRFEKFARNEVESKGIELRCNNSFSVYTFGPDDESLSNYIYGILERDFKGIDYSEAVSERRAAIAKIKEKNDYIKSIKVIEFNLF